MGLLTKYIPTLTPEPVRQVGPVVHLANGLQATVATTTSQPQRVIIEAIGFRSFTDVLLADDARSVAALLAKATVIPSEAGKSTVGSFECAVASPATETRTVIANHHRSRIRMTRLRFTPPSHFATFVYDLDDLQAARLRDALLEAAEECR